MSEALAIIEAEDPKSVFRAATNIPEPPGGLLAQVVGEKSDYLGKQCKRTSVATNPKGETFCYGKFGDTVATLLFYDRWKKQWVPVEGGTFVEGEDPKSIFRQFNHAPSAFLTQLGFEMSDETLYTHQHVGKPKEQIWIKAADEGWWKVRLSYYYEDPAPSWVIDQVRWELELFSWENDSQLKWVFGTDWSELMKEIHRQDIQADSKRQEGEDPKSVLKVAKFGVPLHVLHRAGFERTTNTQYTQVWIRPVKDFGTWFITVEDTPHGLWWGIELKNSEGVKKGESHEGFGPLDLERKMRYLCLIEAREDPKSAFRHLTSQVDYRLEPVMTGDLASNYNLYDIFIGNDWYARVRMHGAGDFASWELSWLPVVEKHPQPPRFKTPDEAAQWVWHHRMAMVSEAEDPKSVLRAASGAAAPRPELGGEVSGGTLRRLCSRYLVNGVYIWYQKDGFPNNEGILQINFKNYGLIRQEWASFGVLAGALLRWRNLEGAPLWINGRSEGKVARDHEVLRHIDSSTWRPGNVHVGGAGIAEAAKPGGEDPKAFFLRMISTGQAAGASQRAAYDEVLQYMPDAFKRALRNKQYAEYRQDDLTGTDNWPSFDDDLDDEGENPWREVFYYFDYYTEGGKLFLLAMQGDMDGDHDVVDEAEVGTPEMDRLLKEYGYPGFKEAMTRYWEWVRDRGEDPLNYIRTERVKTKKTFVAGFVEENGRFKLSALRNVTNPPSPPPVAWPEVKEKAAQDEDWKKAVEYCLLDENGYTEASMDDIIREGGKKDKQGRWVVRFDWEDNVAQAHEREHIIAQAEDALRRLREEP